jgi:hypothetical protein
LAQFAEVRGQARMRGRLRCWRKARVHEHFLMLSHERLNMLMCRRALSQGVLPYLQT